MNDMAKANIFSVMVIIDFALYFLQDWVFTDMEVRDECTDFMGSLLAVKVLNLFHHSGPKWRDRRAQDMQSYHNNIMGINVHGLRNVYGSGTVQQY